MSLCDPYEANGIFFTIQSATVKNGRRREFNGPSTDKEMDSAISKPIFPYHPLICY